MIVTSDEILGNSYLGEWFRSSLDWLSLSSHINMIYLCSHLFEPYVLSFIVTSILAKYYIITRALSDND